MRNKLSRKRCVIVAFLALMPWLSVTAAQAAVQSLHTDTLVHEAPQQIADAQSSLESVAPVINAAPPQVAWVDDIVNAVRMYFKANYPAANFSSYLTILTAVRDAVDRGDRRMVKVEMGTFFTMLANRNDGISEGAAEELRHFARVVMPPQEYGLIFPGSEIEAYGTVAQRLGSEQ